MMREAALKKAREDGNDEEKAGEKALPRKQREKAEKPAKKEEKKAEEKPVKEVKRLKKKQR